MVIQLLMSVNPSMYNQSSSMDIQGNSIHLSDGKSSFPGTQRGELVITVLFLTTFYAQLAIF